MKKITTLLTLFLLTMPALAEQHIVKMLNSGKDGMMVFEPAVLSVNVGDTVKFEATDMAHNSASVLTPGGATPWNGAMSKDIIVKSVLLRILISLIFNFLMIFQKIKSGMVT